jgi:hypothetical protein
MRVLALLLGGAMLASCATEPPPPTRDARSQAQYEQLVGGKVAQSPISCVPNYNTNDMVVIDGRTIAFRRGARTTYIAHLSAGCELIATGTYALLSRQFGGGGTCRGDIQQVLDTSSRMRAGSCTIAEIVPYQSQSR